MLKIVNSYEGKRLYELGQFQSMLSDDYIYNLDNAQTKFIFEQFFKEKSVFPEERLKLLNISYSFASLIVEKFGDYVGEPNSEVINDLGSDFDDFISCFIWGGQAIFRPQLTSNGKFIISKIDPDNYILEDDGSERVLTYIEIPKEISGVTTYVLEETFFENKVSRKLFLINKFQKNQDYSLEGSEVSLSTIDQTSSLKEEEIFNSNFKPLIKVHNRKLKSRKYGTSEFRKVRSLISSIEIEAMIIQDQFLKHLQAKFVMPKSAMAVDKYGNVDTKSFEAIGIETGDIVPTYVFNSNPLIEKAFQQIEDFTRQICAIVTIPTEFVGIKEASGAAESADTKRIRLVSFIKKVEKIRKKFEKAFNELLEIKKILGQQVNIQNIVSWPSIFPENTMEVANELMTAQDAKLISNKRAIMKYQGISEEEALKEQEEINKEKANIDINSFENAGITTV